ncbi:hypothetical protein D3C78_1895380 [compost metagenome]
MEAAVEAMHAVETTRLGLLVLIDLLIHLQLAVAHGDSDTGGVVTCSGEVQLLETP